MNVKDLQKMQADFKAMQDSTCEFTNLIAQKITHEGSRIFILDDDEMDAKLVQRRLQNNGYRTVIGHTVDDLMKTLELNDVGCLVTDLHMPGVDGCQVINKLKDHNIPIIVVTGFDKNAKLCCSIEERGIPVFNKADIDSYEFISSIMVEFRPPFDTRAEDRSA